MLIPDYVKDLPIVALYSLSVYILLIAGFRLLGRRQLGQLTVIDLVIIVIMGSAVETAMVHGNLSLLAGLVSASTLLLANRLIGLAAHRSKRLRRIVSPGPVLCISNGHMITEHLKRNGLTPEDVYHAIRARGFGDICEVKYAVMEEDGEINAVPMTATVVRTEHNIKKPARPAV
jgi:uncharacterized membrane protein YcaP (DUF421 family)